MLKVKEIDTKEFKDELKDLLKDLSIILKSDCDHFELYDKANQFISCFNKLKHDIKDIAQYTDDTNDYLHLGE